MAGNPFHRIVAACAAAALVAVGCTDAGTSSSPPAPPPLAITVNGVSREVPPGTTLGALIAELDLQAEPGRLLSVSGFVLERRIDRGDITINGLHGRHAAALRTNDRVEVVDGEDRIEGTRRVVTELPGMHPTVPQRTLAVYPMKEVDVVGRISGEVVSTEFRPTGRGEIPGAVALTFDDGPWPVQTRQVLKVLRRYHASATFFMVGDLVERYPGIVSDVQQAGMAIGDHSWSHPIDPAFAKLPPHRLTTEVVGGADQLRRSGVEPYLFRPPGGSYDDDVLREARQAGMRTVTWDVDPRDYRDDSTKKELEQYVLRHVQPGSIVLLHDGGGDQHATIGALPSIIKGIRRMGLELTTIPQE